jgi:hypothetical protein
VERRVESREEVVGLRDLREERLVRELEKAFVPLAVGKEEPERAPEAHRDQRRRDAVPRDVRDEDPEAVGLRLEEVVEISAHLRGRDAASEELEARALRYFLR